MQTRIMLVEDRADFASLSFDVAVLDLGLPDGNEADLIGDLSAANPGVAVLILSASLDPKILKRATEAGADEILDKFATPGELVGTIRRLRRGK